MLNMDSHPGVYRFLLATMLLLFMLSGGITLPMALCVTYSDKSRSPDYEFTYVKGNLRYNGHIISETDEETWLGLFDVLDNEIGEPGNNTKLQPGTKSEKLVRIKNDTSNVLPYTAVLYYTNESERELPIEFSFDGDDVLDTTEYKLPEGVSQDKVIRAVSSIVDGNSYSDFSLSWEWEYDIDDDHDRTDTLLANKESLEKLDIGLYIVIDEKTAYSNNTSLPKTGDMLNLEIYIACICINSMLVLFLMYLRRKDKEDEGDAARV